MTHVCQCATGFSLCERTARTRGRRACGRAGIHTNRERRANSTGLGVRISEHVSGMHTFANASKATHGRRACERAGTHTFANTSK